MNSLMNHRRSRRLALQWMSIEFKHRMRTFVFVHLIEVDYITFYL